MAKQNPNSANQIQIYYYDELEKINNYGEDTSGVTLPGIVTSISVTENSDGTWSKTETTQNKPYSTVNEIKNEIIDERDEVVANYENLIKPLDEEMYDYNEQINQKKQLIVDLVDHAITIGCTYISPIIGVATSPGAENIGGVSVGIGSTIRKDRAVINRYTNLDDPRAENPFDPDVDQDMSSSNLGKGYKNYTDNNSGEILTSNYKFIPATLLSHPVIPVGLGASCVAIANSISSLAQEIDALRPLREENVEEINLLKEDKKAEEVRLWGLKQSELELENRKEKLTKLIKNVSKYTDPVVLESLLLWIDASRDYAADNTIFNETGTDDITVVQNLADTSGSSDISTPTKPVYMASDGQSIGFNQYFPLPPYAVENQRIDVGENYISNGISNTYTLEAWFKLLDDSELGSSVSSDGASLVGVDDIRGYGMQLYKPDSIKLNFGGRAGSSSIDSSTDIVKDTWYHVVCTSSPSTGGKIYINGKLDKSGSHVSIPSSAQNLIISTLKNNITKELRARIGLVRVYGKVLSQEEVTGNYQVDVGRFS
jgi:hypothetical protein